MTNKEKLAQFRMEQSREFIAFVKKQHEELDGLRDIQTYSLLNFKISQQEACLDFYYTLLCPNPVEGA